MVGVAQIDGRDTAHVGRHAHLVVGDSDSGPYATDILLALAEDLEDPHLVLVGYGEALATVAIAVALHQVAHQPDGLAGGGTAFKSHTLQLLNHEQPFLVL